MIFLTQDKVSCNRKTVNFLYNINLKSAANSVFSRLYTLVLVYPQLGKKFIETILPLSRL